jgi:subtilisin family serine protease
LPDEETFLDFEAHGTFVSALIAGNGIGMAAMAPDTQIVSVKVLNCANSGSWADIIAGILYAATLEDVHVINMSIQGGFPKNIPGIGALVGYFASAVNYAQEQGKLLVSAGGNYSVNMDKDRNFHWVPAQAGAGIATWAGDIDGDLASYSNFGRTGTWVGAGGGDFDDLDSPALPLPGCFIPPSVQDGVMSACSTYSIWYNCPGNSFYLIGWGGTSFSAPLAAGIAAAVDGKHGGTLEPGELKTTLSNTADDIGKRGTDAIFSHGRVNAGEAATR